MPRPCRNQFTALNLSLGLNRALRLALALTFPLVAGVGWAQSKPAAKPWHELGRTATAAEIKAWDIDVRPDFKGLPAGSGSVARGQEIWERQCESCHGAFGESNEFFTPIVGGTSRQDSESGRVANLKRDDFPQRTTLMKVATLSTLWDYINRAMPWNKPKSLSTDEVYAVTAYILHLGDILPANFVLSERNIAQVQQRMPNRHGMTPYEGMWRVRAKPDVQGDACMRDCAVSAEMRSMLPDHARDSHGNLADQQRLVGPMRGAQTSKLAAGGASAGRVTAPADAAPGGAGVGGGAAGGGTAGGGTAAEAAGIARAANCLACHHSEKRSVGPSFKEVAERYKADPKAPDLLAQQVKRGGQGTWGNVPMPPHPNLKDEEVAKLVRWILAGAL